MDIGKLLRQVNAGEVELKRLTPATLAVGESGKTISDAKDSKATTTAAATASNGADTAARLELMREARARRQSATAPAVFSSSVVQTELYRRTIMLEVHQRGAVATGRCAIRCAGVIPFSCRERGVCLHVLWARSVP